MIFVWKPLTSDQIAGLAATLAERALIDDSVSAFFDCRLGPVNDDAPYRFIWSV